MAFNQIFSLFADDVALLENFKSPDRAEIVCNKDLEASRHGIIIGEWNLTPLNRNRFFE